MDPAKNKQVVRDCGFRPVTSDHHQNAWQQREIKSPNIVVARSSAESDSRGDQEKLPIMYMLIQNGVVCEGAEDRGEDVM